MATFKEVEGGDGKSKIVKITRVGRRTTGLGIWKQEDVDLSKTPPVPPNFEGEVRDPLIDGSSRKNELPDMTGWSEKDKDTFNHTGFTPQERAKMSADFDKYNPNRGERD